MSTEFEKTLVWAIADHGQCAEQIARYLIANNVVADPAEVGRSRKVRSDLVSAGELYIQRALKAEAERDALLAELEQLQGEISSVDEMIGALQTDHDRELGELLAEVERLRERNALRKDEILAHEEVYGQMLENVGAARKERDAALAEIERQVLKANDWCIQFQESVEARDSALERCEKAESAARVAEIRVRVFKSKRDTLRARLAAVEE